MWAAVSRLGGEVVCGGTVTWRCGLRWYDLQGVMSGAMVGETGGVTVGGVTVA